MNDDVKPGTRDIREELKRLIECDRFSNSTSQAAVLEVIVNSHLDGVAMDEKTIGSKTFPGFIPGVSTDVRVNVSNMRKTLAKYYAAEGSYDLVRIEVLKGKNYRVKCSYNPRSDAMKHYLFGLEYASNAGSFPDTIGHGRGHLYQCLSADRNFAPGQSLQAEVLLCEGIWSRHGRTDLRLKCAREHARKALEKDPSLWRAHVAEAACCACAYDWIGAEKSFGNALELAPEATENDPWYCAYLMAIGKVHETLEIASRQLNRRPGTSMWNSLYGLLCYVGYDDMELSFIALATAEFSYSSSSLARLILACQKIAVSSTDVAKKSLFADFSSEDIRYPFEGLKALSLANENRQKEAHEIVKELELERSNGKRESSWELALAYLSLEMIDEALEELEKAQKSHHPLMMWLQRWPFFRMLHGQPKFEELVQNMGLPDCRKL
jgi:hypothetical protein